jgi:hypothetical protein
MLVRAYKKLGSSRSWLRDMRDISRYSNVSAYQALKAKRKLK